MHTLIGGMVRPRAGDLVLAAVTRLGQHRKIEQPNGRRAALHVGDEILVAYADRYAPDQYESHVPADLRRAQLVASGGIASAMLTRSLDVRAPTDITPIGLVGDQHGRPLNVADFALRPAPPPRRAAAHDRRDRHRNELREDHHHPLPGPRAQPRRCPDGRDQGDRDGFGR